MKKFVLLSLQDPLKRNRLTYMTGRVITDFNNVFSLFYKFFDEIPLDLIIWGNQRADNRKNSSVFMFFYTYITSRLCK